LMSVGSSPTMPTSSPITPPESSLQLMSTNEPRMLPPQFGFQAKMDRIDRRLFEFCEFSPLVVSHEQTACAGREPIWS
jgi:hypothetical protein